MSASPIGLLVVHGIGNQLPGELCREIASALADDKRASARQGGEATDRGLLERVTVGAVPVVVAEANWSELSSPDNPPAVRPAISIVRDFFQTVRAAWRQSRLAHLLRRLDRRKFPVGSFTILLSIGILSTGAFAWLLATEGAELPPLLILPCMIVFYGILLHLAVRSARYRWLRLRHAARYRRYLEALLWGVVSLCAGSLFVAPLVLVAEVLLFFSVVVAVAFAVATAAAPVSLAVRGLAAPLRHRRVAAVRRWMHRLGWVMVVLPVHALLESVKATGNLLSVIFTERAWAARLIASGGLAGVYIAFLVLMVLCEILLIPVIVAAVLFWDTPSTGEAMGAVIFFLVFLLLYLLAIKLALPAIDLLLDVANYHLAGDAERRSYHESIERAVVALQRAGCREIHILCHSLGTVLVYDWLQSTRPGDYPVAVLHTLGSPLDKFWYVDHGISRRRADRRGLSAHVSRGWTNFWAYSDPVSGALDHYGDGRLPVRNERLKWLGPLLVSHVRYWNNEIVLGAVRREIAAAQ